MQVAGLHRACPSVTLYKECVFYCRKVFYTVLRGLSTVFRVNTQKHNQLFLPFKIGDNGLYTTKVSMAQSIPFTNVKGTLKIKSACQSEVMRGKIA